MAEVLWTVPGKLSRDQIPNPWVDSMILKLVIIAFTVSANKGFSHDFFFFRELV